MFVAVTNWSNAAAANRQACRKRSPSICAMAARPPSMWLIAQIRVLITVVVLAGYSPFGFDTNHPGHLAISLFIGRRTRVAASQHFDVSSYRESGHTIR